MEYLSVEKIRQLDDWAINKLGIPQQQLMENAGRAVAEYIIENYPQKNYPQVNVVCGKGNNGGDGLVIAEILSKSKYLVQIIKLPQDTDLPPADLMVDAILGTGLKGPVKDIYKEAIIKMNKSGCPIISVDIPSGINGDTGPTSEIYIKPAATVTFVAKKLYMQINPDFFGIIKVVDIGIPLTHPKPLP